MKSVLRPRPLEPLLESEAIQVVARLRPEPDLGDEGKCLKLNDPQVQLLPSVPDKPLRTFTLDRVFGPSATQTEAR